MQLSYDNGCLCNISIVETDPGTGKFQTLYCRDAFKMYQMFKEKRIHSFRITTSVQNDSVDQLYFGGASKWIVLTNHCTQLPVVIHWNDHTITISTVVSACHFYMSQTNERVPTVIEIVVAY